MITPAYALTATERVLPRLALDFTTGVLDSRVTVARALNTATRVNSSGLIETVNANIPRFDYDPMTLQPRGLLIEESRTNLVLRSAEFNETAWTKSGSTIGANAAIAPDGTLSADKIEENNANSPHYVDQSVTTTAVSHGFSVYIKAAERSFVLLWSPTTNFGRVFDVGNGLVSGTVAGVTQATAEITNAGNGWYRCTIYGVCSAASNAFRIYTMTDATTFSYVGTTGSGVLVWGAQVEAGAFATSYIPTTTTSVTRNADTVTMTGTNFSDWYNASEGAFISWFDTLSPTAQRYIYSANAGGAIGNSFFQTVLSNTTDSYIFSGGVQQARLLAGTINANVPAKLGLRYANANFAIAANGGGLQTQLSGSLPVGIDRLHIGRSAGNAAFLNGHIAKLFWYTSLTNAELVAFTK